MKIVTDSSNNRYSIRKCRIGVCSVLVAITFLGTQPVLADEQGSSDSIEVTRPQPEEALQPEPDSIEEHAVTEAPVTPQPTEDSHSKEAVVAPTPDSVPEDSDPEVASLTSATPVQEEGKESGKQEEPARGAGIVSRSAVNPGNSSQATELVQNGDFETTEPATGNWYSTAASGWDNPWIPSSINKSNGAIYANNGQLVIDAKDTFRAAVTQLVAIDPTKRYVFAADVKAFGIVGGGARVRLTSRDVNNKNLSPQEFVYTDTVLGTKDTRIEKLVSLSPEAAYLKVELFFEKGTGTAVFDNVSLKEYVPASSTFDKKGKPETGTVSIDTGKVYVPNRKDLTYEVVDTTVATLSNNMIFPKQSGTTLVRVYDQNGEVSHFTLTVTPHQETIFDELQRRWEEISLANNRFDTNDPNKVAFLQKLEQTVDTYVANWRSPSRLEPSLFENISLNQSAGITSTYRNLEKMSQVITNPFSKYYRDRELIDKVKKGMAWLYEQVYNENKEINGNWWDYEIGGPLALLNTLVYMNPYFSQEEIETYTKPIRKFVPDTTMIRMTTPNPVPAVGGNQTDISKVAILEGALRREEQRIRDGVHGLTTIMKFVSSGEGFYKDGSFIDHSNVAYTGAYGNVLLDGFSQILPVIQSSPFELPEEKTQILQKWIEKAFMPILVKGELLDMTRGRSVSRQQKQSHVYAVEILSSLVRIAESAKEPEKSALLSFVKGQVLSDTFNDIYKHLRSYKEYDLFNALLSNDQIQPKPAENVIAAFNNMDKFVYHNAEQDFTFALSMYSNKTQNYEDMNDENRRGWYTSDGMVYLYNGDLSHYSNNYWPTVDPYRLAGTTTTKDLRKDGSGEVTLTSSFVGASQLGNRLATLAMDFNNWNNSLTARKAWFVLGNKIVFLGTQVEHQSGKGAVTTVENRKLVAGENYQYYINGQAVDLSHQVTTGETKTFYMTNGKANQSIGYAFLTPLSTQAKVEKRVGKWSDINYGQSKDAVENSFVTLWHEQPQTASNYAYVLVPNQSMETVDKIANSVQVLHQDRDLQVVYDQEQKAWGIVKYTSDPYTVEGMTLTDAGLYMIQAVKDGYHVAFYNPLTRAVDKGLVLTTAGATLTVEQAPTEAYPSTIWKVTLPTAKEKELPQKEEDTKVASQSKASKEATPTPSKSNHADESPLGNVQSMQPSQATPLGLKKQSENKAHKLVHSLPQTADQKGLGISLLGLLSLVGLVRTRRLRYEGVKNSKRK